MPQLTSHFFKQAPQESLADLPLFHDGPKKIRLIHIVNAYVDYNVPRNMAVQELTFETFRVARRTCGEDALVSDVGVTFPDESYLIPTDFVPAPTLFRSVTDVATFQINRRLPLLFDILNAGVDADQQYASVFSSENYDDEFLVITNSDIHLVPGFYLALIELIRSGYDVITINRRTISNRFNPAVSHALMAGEYGQDHPGLDCFVFPKRMLSKFVRSNSCVGAGYVMRSLLFNLAVHANRFAMLTQVHLTYHIGDDQIWTSPKFSDYTDHNFQEAMKVASSLGANDHYRQKLLLFFSAHGELTSFLDAANGERI